MRPETPPARLAAKAVTLGFGARTVVRDLSLAIPDGGVTVIVGPNACGKSTLLRSLARLIRPTRGEVLLDGQAIASLPTREVARRLGILSQTATAPEGILVADLVARGRTPHHGILQRWSEADAAAVRDAMAATRVDGLADRPVDQLSGGQRQRVWIALALAQETDLLLLDEPTTFLDLAHQIDILDLVARLNRARGTTVVMVLHDLNLACRYAGHLIAMRDGAILAAGRPERIVTPDFMQAVFGLDAMVIADPCTGTPLVVPKPVPGGDEKVDFSTQQ